MAISLKVETMVSAFEKVRPTYTLFSGSLETLVARLCTAQGLHPEISSRTKDTDSLRTKLKRKQYSELGETPDLSGVRAIVRHPSEVDAVARLLHREFEIVEDDLHESDRPDAFGYASRHLVVSLSPERARLAEWAPFEHLRAEIQLRTILQHAWASISHSLDYKHGYDAPPEVRRKLFQVAAMIEVSDDLFEQFRKEVGQVDDAYEQQAETGEWRSLPIDVNSLKVTYSEWQPIAVHDLAHQRLNVSGETSRSEHVEFLQQITALARALDLSTVGELAELMSSRELAEVFDAASNGLKTSPGSYTLDYLALLSLARLALARGVDVPTDVSIDRLMRSWGDS